jgi:hypothetical protein
MSDLHRRSVIFDAVKAAIAEIPDFASAGKVERGRTRAIPEEKLPAVTLTWSEREETATLRPHADGAERVGYARMLPISIVLHLRDRNPDEEFDRLAALIETRLGSAIELDGAIIEMILDRSGCFVDPRTGLPLCAGRLVYLCDYITLTDPRIAGR